MKKETKWGLFLHDVLILEYDSDTEGYKQALEDAKFAYREIGIAHEIKRLS